MGRTATGAGRRPGRVFLIASAIHVGDRRRDRAAPRDPLRISGPTRCDFPGASRLWARQNPADFPVLLDRGARRRVPRRRPDAPPTCRPHRCASCPCRRQGRDPVGVNAPRSNQPGSPTGHRQTPRISCQLARNGRDLISWSRRKINERPTSIVKTRVDGPHVWGARARLAAVVDTTWGASLALNSNLERLRSASVLFHLRPRLPAEGLLELVVPVVSECGDHVERVHQLLGLHLVRH